MRYYMPVTPNDDIVEISRRCDTLRKSLATAADDVKMIPLLKYKYLCAVSGERPNSTFLRFSNALCGGTLSLHRAYLSQRGMLPILLTLPLCPWLEYINVREQRLTTTLIELLCEALMNLPRVRLIDVSGNPFGSFGVRALLRLVLRKRTIVDCYVGDAQGAGSLLRRLHMACERNRKREVEEYEEERKLEGDEEGEEELEEEEEYEEGEGEEMEGREEEEEVIIVVE